MFFDFVDFAALLLSFASLPPLIFHLLAFLVLDNVANAYILIVLYSLHISPPISILFDFNIFQPYPRGFNLPGRCVMMCQKPSYISEHIRLRMLRIYFRGRQCHTMSHSSEENFYPPSDTALRFVQDDKSTRAVHAALQSIISAFNTFDVQTRHRVAGLLVFHCAVYRKFGTAEFIKSCGFMDVNSWTDAVRGIVDAAVRCEGPAFTTAYGPSRVFHYVECRTTNEGDFRRFVEDAT